MARYGQAYKDRIVARLLPPESSAVEVVSRQVGVSVVTLEQWRADRHRGDGRNRPQCLVPRARPVSGRTRWLDTGCHSGLGEPRATSAAEAREDRSALRTDATPSGQPARRRVKELERELHRKDKALAETAALLVLRKKLAAVFHQDEDA